MTFYGAAAEFSLSVGVDSFVGDGSNTAFTLSTTPFNENYTSITINGVTQHKSAYSLYGSVITFSEAPPNGYPIDVVTYYGTNDTTGPYANAAYSHANAAYSAANNATDTWVRNAANSASSYANSAYALANTIASGSAAGAYLHANAAYVSANASANYIAIGTANSAAVYANAAYLAANASINFIALGVANTANQHSISSYRHANAGYVQANTANIHSISAYTHTNAAYTLANTKFASSGGTISGDVNVTGNLTITGQTTYANTTTVLLGDNIITLNADIPMATAPTENAGLEVARGSSTNTAILWNETTDKWTFTNDGTNYSNLGSAAAESYANSAYLAANASVNFIALGTANVALTTANAASSYANSAYTQANANYTSAVTKLTVTNSGSSGYLIDQYTGNNPAIYVSAGETIAFLLNNVTGHPFMIRVSSGGSNYDTGLTHVSTSGVVSTDSSAQAQTSGTLYWKVPFDLAGSTYVYQCQIHSGMVGNIVIQQPVSSVASNTNLAYIQANAAFAAANNAVDTWVRSAANSASSYANGAFTAANNKVSKSGDTITGDLIINGNITVSGCTATLTVETLRVHDSIVDVAYDVTGTPALDAGIRVVRGDLNPVLLKWNESIDKWTFTNDGTNYSNVGSSAAEVYANSAYLHANAAFAVANTGGGAGTDTFAREQANSAYIHANAAFTVANTGGGASTDTYARNTANAAYIQANTALSLNVAVDSFTGDGSNTAFTLTATPFSKNFTTVTLDGISQHKSVYNVSSNILTFSDAPDIGVAIDISTYYGGQQGSGQYQTRTYVGNGSTVNYTVSARTSANSILVMENGVVQTPIADYTLAGTTLTFVTAPASGTNIHIREMSYGSDDATTASLYANGAYLTANSGSSYANSAYIQANSAFSTANTKASTGKAIAMAIVFGF